MENHFVYYFCTNNLNIHLNFKYFFLYFRINNYTQFLSYHSHSLSEHFYTIHIAVMLNIFIFMTLNSYLKLALLHNYFDY
jgi:hypothetical protein